MSEGFLANLGDHPLYVVLAEAIRAANGFTNLYLDSNLSPTEIAAEEPNVEMRLTLAFELLHLVLNDLTADQRNNLIAALCRYFPDVSTLTGEQALQTFLSIDVAKGVLGEDNTD